MGAQFSVGPNPEAEKTQRAQELISGVLAGAIPYEISPREAVMGTFPVGATIKPATTWYRGLRETGKPKGKSELGRWFSSSEEVAGTYGKDVIAVNLDVNNPFKYRSAPYEEYLEIGKKLGDEKHVRDFFNTVGVNRTDFLDRWINKFGYGKLKKALEESGYDSILNPRGETLSTWGPTAPEMAVFGDNQIRELPGKGRADVISKRSGLAQSTQSAPPLKAGDFVEFQYGNRWVKGKIRDIDEIGNTVWVMNADPETPKMGDNQTTAVNLSSIKPVGGNK